MLFNVYVSYILSMPLEVIALEDSLFLSHHLPGVPAQSALHSWEPGSSQRPGGWRPDGQAVGPGLGVPQEHAAGTGTGRRHGDEEVAGS